MNQLQWPEGTVDIVLDTDTYNEIDDQFALIYAMLSVERFRMEAVYAAPFHNARSVSPADGMTKSYEEIIRILGLLDVSPDGFAYKGSTSLLLEDGVTESSPAVDDLVQRARADRAGPLYVVAIGAITNVASALLKAPDIRERIVVLWLGGHALNWHDTREFNLQGDPAAARVVLDCGVPVILFPCFLVADALTTTPAELDCHLRGNGELGEYLYGIFESYEHGDIRSPGSSKVIWDLAPLAWLIDQRWFSTYLTSSPIITEDLTWSRDDRRHLIRVACRINRDGVFSDLFSKISRRIGS